VLEPSTLITAPLLSSLTPSSLTLSSLASPETDLGDWGSRTAILHDILVATWGLNIVNWVFLGRALNWFGVRPRTPVGLLGIVFSPFLHGSVVHLLSNSLVFFVLGWMVLLRGPTEFVIVTVIVALAEGLGVWCFGRSANHIGGSGVIFGYFGFLLFGSFFDQNLMALILSIAVGMFYWWMLPGMLPVKNRRISWEGHLFGFIGGVLAAQFLPLIRGFFI
jgi:membrane associated rhomboid family serine protease